MKDYVLRGKIYLRVWPPGSNYRFVKELRHRIKESERAAFTDNVLACAVVANSTVSSAMNLGYSLIQHLWFQE
ncbi:hypothetical protein SADUNF_Sadunf02G0037000 [Salix dunnii]|uniref:Uncharacterized protein n=1 Tax=Salix dunnii TaxID=1413687 RepID=A0A835N5Y2_9ROSI|nr:hypothetical protein SADUNF_Sadunf02G0037000 [Salix dunnii]